MLGNLLNAVSNNGYSFSGGLTFLLGAVQALFNPIYAILNTVLVLGYTSVIVLELVMLFVNVIMAIYEFIFAPVFV